MDGDSSDNTVCKICRCGWEAGQLYSPCKCKGSIGFTHETCLFDWLNSRKGKERCEVCETYYRFSKIYAKNVPSRLPVFVLVKRLIISSAFTLLLTLRALLVLFCWIALLPWCTVWIFRFYTYSGHNCARALNAILFWEKLPPITPITSMYPSISTVETNLTSAVGSLATNLTETITDLQSLNETMTEEAKWKRYQSLLSTLGKDCFTGQLITCGVVVLFICIFLLREWVGQQAGPDVLRQPGPVPLALEMPHLAIGNAAQRIEIEDFHVQHAHENRYQQGHGEVPFRFDFATGVDEIQPNPFLAPTEADVRLTPRRPASRSSSPPILMDELSWRHRQHVTGFAQGSGESSSSDSQPFTSTNYSPNSPNSPDSIRSDVNITSDEEEHNNSSLVASSDKSNSDSEDDQLSINGDDPPGIDEDADEVWIDNLAEDLAIRADGEGPGFDDLEGILEAIGMRGNLLILFQTVALVTLGIAVVLATIYWLPFVIGRTFIAVRGLYYILFGPIALVRIVTDPLVDYFSVTVNTILGRDLLSRIAILSKSIESEEHSDLQQSQLKSYFRKIATISDEMWTRLSQSERPIDRTVCVAVGYLVVLAIAGAWYIREKSLDRPWSQKVQRILKQNGVVTKVAFFILIELLLFPAVCGFFLSLSVIPLFPESSLNSRLDAFRQAPYSTVFLTWTAGTIFMFIVAQWISLCRATLRKGAMFFIRDPRDPDAHPVKEMAESPIVVQLGKLGKSVVLYSALMTAISNAAFVLKWLVPQLLPVRWDLGQPVSHVPFDLLLAYLILPMSIRVCKPVRTSKRLFSQWTTITAHQLRLSSFLLDKRVPSEEGSWKRRKGWFSALNLGHFCQTNYRSPPQVECEGKVWVPSGSLARAPAVDGLKLLPNRPATIPIHPDGTAITEEGAETLAAYKSSGSKESDWQTIYIPPYFRFRLMLALYLLWVSGSAFAISLCVFPLLAGRFVLDSILTKPLHDGYAILVGMYLVYPTIWLLFRVFAAFKTEHLTSVPTRKRRAARMAASKSLAAKIADTLYGFFIVLRLFVSGCIALPVLLGVLCDMFLFAPITPFAGTVHTFWIPQLWAYGVVELSIAYGIFNFFARGTDDWSRATEKFSRWSLKHNFIQTANELQTELVNPLLGQLTAYLSSSIIVAKLGNLVFSLTMSAATAMRLKLFWTRIGCWQCAFAFLNRVTIWNVWSKLSKKWIQSVKDQEYLLERHIMDYQEPLQEDAVEPKNLKEE